MNELQKDYFEKMEKEQAEAEAAEEARLMAVMESERKKDAIKQEIEKKAAEEAERKAEEEAIEIINRVKAEMATNKKKQKDMEEQEKAEKLKADTKKKNPESEEAEEKEEAKEKEEAEEEEENIYEREPVGEASMPKKSPKFKKGAKKGGESKATPENKAAADREAKLQELADEYQDKYKRLLAEFENARAREAKEASRMYDMGAKAVLEKLLPIVDNFERAIQTIPEEDRERGFEQGVDKIYKQMMTILEEIGVQPMNAEGTEFNPDMHNAVMHVEDESYGENIVAEEMQKGYMYKESVLRYSMVKVAN